jgi:anti-sigma B factor antagonist
VDLTTDVQACERSATVTLLGDLDVAGVNTFRRLLDDLLRDGHVEIVLDLNKLGFLDSSGLGALISARRRTYAAGGSLTLVCDDNQVLWVLEITNLDRVFQIVPSRPGPDLGGR